MKTRLLLSALLASALFAPAAHATPTLLAIGNLSGNIADLSAQTAGPLENGVAGNLLGGLGSGFAYAGGNTFIALPDRGPNAVAYDSLIDDTASYINRLQTIQMTFAKNPNPGLPFTLTPTLVATTLLSSPTPLVYGSGAGLGVGPGAPPLNTSNTFYFTGRSDNFDSNVKNSLNPSNARLDPEGVRVANDGKSVFVSDEYGPYVYQFDRATGQRIKSFTLPDNLAVTNLSPNGQTEINNNSQGRIANKGMEGLAITPDGKTLVGVIQAALEQDGGKTGGKIIRIVTIDVASGTTHQYAYALTTGTGVSEILAINSHEFMLDERDGKGLGDNSTAVAKTLYKIDLNGATDVSDKSGESTLAPFAVPKTKFLDLVAALTAAGINAKDIPAKLEGLAFGPDLMVGNELEHTLFITNDNDFLGTITDTNHPNGFANPNNFYVFGISFGDLPTYSAQQLVPEPSSAALLLSGLCLLGVLIAWQRQRPRRGLGTSSLG